MRALSPAARAIACAALARLGQFSEVESGIEVLVRRPYGFINSEFVADLRKAWDGIIGDDYPEQELISYWFNWSSKLLFHRTFAKVFRDRQHNE